MHYYSNAMLYYNMALKHTNTMHRHSHSSVAGYASMLGCDAVALGVVPAVLKCHIFKVKH